MKILNHVKAWSQWVVFFFKQLIHNEHQNKDYISGYSVVLSELFNVLQLEVTLFQKYSLKHLINFNFHFWY